MLSEAEQPLAERLLRNTFFNAVGRVWLIGSNLLLTPLFLSYLGQDRFAVWVLFWTVSHYALMLDCGLGTALVKYFAEYKGREDVRSFNQAVSSVLCFYLALGGGLFLVLWPAAEWIASGLGWSGALASEAVQMFRVGLLVLVLMNVMVLFDAVLKGLQRMELTNITLMLVSIPNVLGSYWALRQGWGLRGLAWVTAAVFLLQVLLLAGFAKRSFPALSLARGLVSLSVIRLLFDYGVRLQITRIADLVSFQADKILLALLMPIRYVTFYDLGAKVASVVHELPFILFNAVFPAASHLAGREDHQRLWLLYERGTKYLLLLSLPMLAGLWLTAHLILQVWLGHVSNDVLWAVLLLSTGYWTTIGLGMVTTVGAGIGWVKPIMRAGLGQALLNLVCSTVLILTVGYRGALIGTMLALLLSNAYLLVRFCRDFNRSLGDHLRQVLRMALVNLPPILLALPYLFWAKGWVAAGDRASAFVALVGCVGLYLLGYLASIRWSGVLDRQDWELLGGYLPFLRSLVRVPV